MTKDNVKDVLLSFQQNLARDKDIVIVNTFYNFLYIISGFPSLY
jgi:hypothetical protein